ncbi:hypothetical protein [Pelodictyon luteolum]|uniref:hypothetical protein n=1 Tax=Pelodictyon luteolum TaxID=1100 RepID=UPI0012FED30E|nr:hypothetical protein [Pelodictyon luteolum]
MNTQQYETTNTHPSPENQANPASIRLKLACRFAFLLPGSGECRTLSTEEKIIACMAKKHPTLFIS